MARYGENEGRPDESSVAQTEDTSQPREAGHPFPGLEARVDSLESGDAFGAGDPSDVLTRGDPTPEWAPGGGGGGADLGAVDEDIVVLNSHVADFQGDIGSDAATRTSIGWRDDNYGLCVTGPEGDATSTDLYVQRPGVRNQYVNISTYYGGHRPSVQFRMLDGAGPSTLNARLYIVGEATIETDDVRHTASHGPILVAPDASLHRLIVANDGTLSTEPVV